MKLGAFSISLSVKNLERSKEFYEYLGFSIFGGSMEDHYLVMRNQDTLVGLYEGMFEGNLLTFNPGWDQDCNSAETFDDVRQIYETVKSCNIDTDEEALEGKSGPGSFVMTDPDGNVILIDQHI